MHYSVSLAADSENRQPFRLTSVLPEHDPNPVLDHLYGVGRAIERVRDTTADALLHPIDTVKDMAVMMWDGGNAISDMTLGQSTKGARNRNAARGEAMTHAFEEFKHGSSVRRLEMVTELITTCILGGAVGSAPRALISEFRALRGTALKTSHGFVFGEFNQTARAAKEHALTGGNLYRAGKTAKRAESGRYWSLEKPIDSTYAARHGLPLDNLPINYVAEAQLKPGSSVITRKAEAVARNQGGAIEVVVKNPSDISLTGPAKPITDPAIRNQALGARSALKAAVDEAVRKTPLEPGIGAAILTEKTVNKRKP